MIRAYSSSGHCREYVLAVTREIVDGQPLLVRRLFYYSHSGGGWRVTHATVGGVIAKGSRQARHYTAETQLTRPMIEALTQVQRMSTGSQGRIVNTWERDLIDWMAVDPGVYFKANRADLHGEDYSMTFGFGDRSQFVETPALRNIQQYSPGKVFKNPQPTSQAEASISPARLVSELAHLRYPSRFIPDFNQNPLATYEGYHEIMGRVVYEEYAGGMITTESGQMRPIIWTMAHTEGHKTWVQSIQFADAKINSYGVPSEILDSGIITSKPVEYRKQSTLLQESPWILNLANNSPYAQSYVDITPVLELLLPIRAYRQAKNLPVRPLPPPPLASTTSAPTSANAIPIPGKFNPLPATGQMGTAPHRLPDGLGGDKVSIIPRSALVALLPGYGRPASLQMKPWVWDLCTRIFPERVMARVGRPRPPQP